MSNHEDIPRSTRTEKVNLNHFECTTISEVIEELQELSQQHPEGYLYITTDYDYRYDETTGVLEFNYPRPESEEEYNKRVAYTLQQRQIEKEREERAARYKEEVEKADYKKYLELKAKFEK